MDSLAEPDPEEIGDKPRKRLVWVLATALAIGALGAWRAIAHRPKVPTYTTVRMTRGPIQSKVTASGTLSALVTVQV
ncbi:MAG: efflux RND transporter periplasmic adaptor subunit, partial [Cyanobacteria bacterium REEB65]|nr:efflux RND transporter periplasmic adaptor subunit [Cyanobacteria bacterium REEB65]